VFGMTRPVPTLSTLFSKASQIRHLVETVGTRIRRKLGSNEREIERARPTDFGGALDNTGIAGEATGLLEP
jgi:hypothetical protein